jgi:hypothetical protein
MLNFLRRSIEVAKAGGSTSGSIMTGCCFRLPRTGTSGNLTGLTPTAAELQEKIMQLPAEGLRKVEVFEKRVGTSYA